MGVSCRIEAGRKRRQCSCNSVVGTQRRQPRCSHLPGLVVVLYLTQVSAAGLRNPLPRDQVPHHHRGRADFWKGNREENTWEIPQNMTAHLGKQLTVGKSPQRCGFDKQFYYSRVSESHDDDDDDGKSNRDEG